MKIDLSPHPQRKTVFSGLTFHFLDPASPYAEIVPLAGGHLDVSSISEAAVAASPLSSNVIVFPSDGAPELSPDTAAIAMTRPLSEAATAWVRRGWLPLAEQDLMRALVFDGEMRRLLTCAEQRCEKEMREREESVGLLSEESVEVIEDESVKTVSSSESVKTVSEDELVKTRENESVKTRMESESVKTRMENESVKKRIKDGSVKARLEDETIKTRLEDISVISITPKKPSTRREPVKAEPSIQPVPQNELKNTNTPPITTLRGLKRPQQMDDGDDVEAFFREVDNGEAKRVREKERASSSVQVESESSESEPYLSEELESEPEDRRQSEVAEVRVEETTSGKGKRFKKKAFKKATGFVPLHPYQGSRVS